MATRISRGISFGLALSLASSCARPPRTEVFDAGTPTGNNDVFEIDPLVDVVKPISTQAVEVGSVYSTLTPWPTATREQVEAESTQEIVAGGEVGELINPFAGHVFSQRCGVYSEDGRWVFDCVEAWASLPLPGGSQNPAKNYLGSSTCNSAATSFVINQLVPPEVIDRAIGTPGIDPKILVYGVYQNLPNGLAFKMNSNGAGFEKVIPALEVFGLKATVVDRMSWWTIADFVNSLEPGQTLMISMLGTNAKGRPFQHYSVAGGVDEDGRVYFNDSFFYEDPERAETDMEYRQHVYFEDSPNIMNDPNSPIGKRVDIVGAAVIEAGDFEAVEKLIDSDLLFRDPINGLDHQQEFATGRSEFMVTERGLLANELSFVEAPVAVGPNRYRVKINYRGLVSDVNYYDANGGLDLPDLNKLLWYRFGDYVIPLLKQNDPEWSTLPISRPSSEGVVYPFGKRGCGQAVAASILSMMRLGGEEIIINPYEFYQTYFPELEGGRGTFPTDYEPIFSNSGFDVTWIDRSERGVRQAVFEGKLVMIQGSVDFKWGSLYGGRVNHFVLVLGTGSDGELVIFDPVWGVGVTTLSDIDFSQSSGVMAIGLP